MHMSLYFYFDYNLIMLITDCMHIVHLFSYFDYNLIRTTAYNIYKQG